MTGYFSPPALPLWRFAAPAGAGPATVTVAAGRTAWPRRRPWWPASLAAVAEVTAMAAAVPVAVAEATACSYGRRWRSWPWSEVGAFPGFHGWRPRRSRRRRFRADVRRWRRPRARRGLCPPAGPRLFWRRWRSWPGRLRPSAGSCFRRRRRPRPWRRLCTPASVRSHVCGRRWSRSRQPFRSPARPGVRKRRSGRSGRFARRGSGIRRSGQWPGHAFAQQQGRGFHRQQGKFAQGQQFRANKVKAQQGARRSAIKARSPTRASMARDECADRGRAGSQTSNSSSSNGPGAICSGLRK